MTKRRRWTFAAIAMGAVLVTALLAWIAIRPSMPEREPPPAAQPSAESSLPASDPALSSMSLGKDFLENWVEDGRVVRLDEGSDTVSEGQAYGLLIAVAVGSESDVDAIWRWTSENMQRSDGLLAWQWDNGVIVDDEPASDADLDAARALLLAGDRFDRPDFTEAGIALANIIADRLTVETGAGRILLPGLWAAEKQPYAYNPSYASPVAFDVIGAATADPRWAELSAGSAAVTSALLDATALPPDWAQVHPDGRVEAMPGAEGGGTDVLYSYDAARLSLRYAESCDPDDVALAARVLDGLGRGDGLRASLDLGGGALTEDEHPLAYGARAAASAASGDRHEAADDLERAAELSVSTPTYYGRAWTALSYAILTTTELGSCPPLEVRA